MQDGGDRVPNSLGDMTGRAAAEEARVIHDTVINTLGAIAGGGRIMADTALVQRRCAHDVATVETLFTGRRDADGEYPVSTIAGAAGIELRVSGLNEGDADRYSAMVSAKVSRAVQGAVQELIRNAVKHSGAGRVDVEVNHTGSTLTVAVIDHGRGFDGRAIPGRGLAESVLARARDAGVGVTIRTAPAAGTSVTLVIALDGEPADPAAGHPRPATTRSAEPERGAPPIHDRRADESWARWGAAGLRGSLELLRRIARGEADPQDPRVRSQCAEAERNLRQALLLSPEIVHLKPWIVRALADARAKSVSLTVRGYPQDAPDEELAESLGRVILAGVEALPPGIELNVGLFRDEGGSRLLMVGPRGSFDAMTIPPGLPENSEISRQRLEQQDLVEFATTGRRPA